jgi:hypothetical protein
LEAIWLCPRQVSRAGELDGSEQFGAAGWGARWIQVLERSWIIAPGSAKLRFGSEMRFT